MSVAQPENGPGQKGITEGRRVPSCRWRLIVRQWLMAVTYCTLVGSLAVPTGAEETPEGPSCQRFACVKVATPPIMDGSLDDQCWGAAARLSHFVIEQPQPLTDRCDHVADTSPQNAWLAYDGGSLYMAFRQEGRGPTGGEESRVPHFEDTIHVLVARGRTEEPLHLTVDLAGNVEKASGPDGDLLDYRSARTKVSVGNIGRTVELGIPFAGRPPLEGEAWWVNLGAGSPGAQGTNSLVCTYGGLDDVMSFAQMEFVERGIVLKDLDLGDERGDWGGSALARATLRNGLQSTVEVTLQAITLPGGRTFGPPPTTLAPGEEKTLEWAYGVEQPSGNRMTVLVRQGEGRTWCAELERPLRDRFLFPRLASVQGLLSKYETYLAQVVVNLGESAALQKEVRRLGEEAAAQRRNIESAEGKWQECRDAIEQLEQATVRVGLLVGILESYSLTEMTAGTMERKFACFSAPASAMATYLALPSPDQMIRGVKARACPGEQKSLSFQIASAESLRNVTLEMTDLVGDSGAVPQQELRLWVVNCWHQGGKTGLPLGEAVGTNGDGTPPGGGNEPQERILVPELLLKDDREPLVGRKPALRLQGPVVTDIPAGVSKQFWLTVRIPEDVVPGLYRGRIILKIPELTSYELPLEVEVLPFRLVVPRQRLGVYLLGRLGGEGRMTLGEYQRQLRDIREHGFGQASIDDGPGFLVQALTLRAVETLDEEAVWTAPSYGDVGLAETVGLVSSVPLACEVELGDALGETAATVHAGGAKTFAEIERPLSLDEAAALDLGCFKAESPLFASHLGKKEQGTYQPSAAMEYYSWDAWREDALKNRLLCGLYLWKWGLDGAMPYVYQEVVDGDPYEEAAPTGKRRHQMLTYPSLRGPVSTLQWEACRDGIYDLRYVATLDFWLDKAKREINQLIEAGEDSTSERAVDLMKAYAQGKGVLDAIRGRITAHPDRILQGWTARSFDALRDEITEGILELWRLLANSDNRVAE